MLDHFVVGRVERISPEAPVPVVRFEREDFRLGGAANVAHNVAALGGRVEVIGVTGEDPDEACMRRALEQLGVGTRGIVTDRSRRTTRKLRVVTTRNQQVARIDYEDDREVDGDVEAEMIERISRLAVSADAILVSDYLKGGVTPRVMAAAIAAGERRRIPVLVDPKIPHLPYYAGATLITPNHHEAEVATHRRVRTHEEARAAAADFRSRARCSAILMTRGDQGMWLLDEREQGHLPAAAREVADVTGAGDTVIATLAVSLAAGATLAEGAWLANQAAGIVVGKFGPATVNRDELVLSMSRGDAEAPRP
jgi:D-beta-D-heptose 7-phosphate kinase/D-beta-D-heptose 1-phosphate adenosyltransferase